MRPTAPATLAVALAMTLVTACTGEAPEAPQPTPWAPTATGPTPATTAPLAAGTPTPAAIASPQPPPQLALTDEAGAAAAASHFVSLYGYVMSTGDTEAWAAMSGAPCEFCRRITEDAKSMRTEGEVYSGGEIELSDIRVLPRDDLTGGYPVDAQFVQKPVLHTAADGTILTETDGDSGVVEIDTIHSEGSWKVLAVAVKDG